MGEIGVLRKIEREAVAAALVQMCGKRVAQFVEHRYEDFAYVDGVHALDARKEVLDAKVADGTITQEQADAAYERMSERIEQRVTTDEVGRPAWAGQGRGQGRGMGAGNCGACTSCP